VHDDLSARDLRRIRECPLQLLVTHPRRCDARRLVGLCRCLEEADGTHDAVTGLDEVVTAEARHLGQAGQQVLADVLDELVGATLVDSLVPDRELGTLLIQLAQAGFHNPIIRPVEADAVPGEEAAAARVRNADLAENWRLVREREGQSYQWPEERERYSRYRVFTGLTRAEGAVISDLARRSARTSGGATESTSSPS
jgi:hypothetical protein